MVHLTTFIYFGLVAVASASPILNRRAGEPIEGQYIVTFKEQTGNGFVERNVCIVSSQTLSTKADTKIKLQVDALIDEVLAQAIPTVNAASFSGNTTEADCQNLNQTQSLLFKYDVGPQFQGFAAKLPSSALETIKSHPQVESIDPDTWVEIAGVQNNLPAGLYGLDLIDGTKDNRYTFPDAAGEGVDAYVIDTGILTSHPDFGGRATFGASFTGESGQGDNNGHGTHVAGTIGSNTFGVAKKVNLIAVRVLAGKGGGATSGVVAGINWVAQNARRTGRKSVANMSLGGGVSSAIDRAARALINSGVALAVAAGNSAKDACTGSPSRVREAMTVAASDVNMRFASFSEFGACVDIIAPGKFITVHRNVTPWAWLIESYVIRCENNFHME